MNSRNARGRAAASPRGRSLSLAAPPPLIPTVVVDGLKVTITINAPPAAPYGGDEVTGSITGPEGAGATTKDMTPVAGTNNQVEVTVDGPGTYTATVTCGDRSVTVEVEVTGAANQLSVILAAPPHAAVVVRHTGSQVVTTFDLTPPKGPNHKARKK